MIAHWNLAAFRRRNCAINDSHKDPAVKQGEVEQEEEQKKKHGQYETDREGDDEKEDVKQFSTNSDAKAHRLVLVSATSSMARHDAHRHPQARPADDTDLAQRLAHLQPNYAPTHCRTEDRRR